MNPIHHAPPEGHGTPPSRASAPDAWRLAPVGAGGRDRTSLADPGLWFRSVAGRPLPDPAALEGDDHFMALALEAGLAGLGRSSPNPSVGCVLVKDGRIIGRGGHVRAGGPHAEILALGDARSRGEDPAGATVYVTLEPCCHHGRTPPCTDALLEAGIARAVAGVQDPNPLVSGGGLRRLREAGVAVASGVLGEACAALHWPFFKRIHSGLPLVVLFEHTRPEPGSEPHFRWLRASLRLGAEAVCMDVPSLVHLDLRLRDPWPHPAPPQRTRWRVLLDPAGRLHPAHRFMNPIPGQLLLRVLAEPRKALPFVEDLVCPDARGRIDLPGMLRHLAAREVNCLLVEGGRRLTGPFRERGLADVVVS